MGEQFRQVFLFGDRYHHLAVTRAQRRSRAFLNLRTEP